MFLSNGVAKESGSTLDIKENMHSFQVSLQEMNTRHVLQICLPMMTSNLKRNEMLQAQHFLPAVPARPVGADEPLTSCCWHMKYKDVVPERGWESFEYQSL